MSIPLSKKEIEIIVNSLDENQKAFLLNKTKVSKKSKWLEVLAKHKGIVIDEQMHIEDIEDTIEDWVLHDILDGGIGQRRISVNVAEP